MKKIARGKSIIPILTLMMVTTGCENSTEFRHSLDAASASVGVTAEEPRVPVNLSPKVVLEPEAQKIVDATANPPFVYDLGPEKARENLDKLQSGPVRKLPVDEKDLTIKGGPTGEVSLKIVRPKNVRGNLPVILYIHGGGWVLGNAHTHDRLIRDLAVGSQSVVVFPNYSLSPEAKYPVAIEQVYTALKWIADNGKKYGMNPDKLTVAGDSVGGNMTAAVTLMDKDRGGPPIHKQLLFYPVTNASFDTESYKQFATGYYLRRDVMQWFWDQYTTDPKQRAEIYASPLRATTEQLRGLPPALVITDEADVLRDEGEAYAAKLRQAGVPVTAVRVLGTIHDFMMLNDLANTQAVRGATMLANEWLRK
ncbi:alpha/beta hydrolase [Brevibacillus fluminis]|nr:alpha/beta hydrolase [Brevibacillus fluminis]